MQRCFIAFLGESFRSGLQGSRIIGDEKSVEEQMLAVKTHKQFVKLFPSAFIYVGTYNTQYSEKLLKEYNPDCYDIYPNNIRLGLNTLFHNSLKWINVYDFSHIMFIRIDLFLKDLFFESFELKPKITFPSVCWKRNYRYRNGCPRINDTMIFIPKRYFHFLPFFHISHECWLYLIKHTCLNNNDFDCFLKTLHDSDSAKDFNPIYRIVNRPECQIFHSEGIRLI